MFSFHTNPTTTTATPAVFVPPPPVEPGPPAPAVDAREAAPALASDSLALTGGQAPARALPGSEADLAEFDALFQGMQDAPEPFVVPPLTEADIPPHQAQFYSELGRAAEGPARLFNMVGKHLEVSRYDEDLDSGDPYQNGSEPKPEGVAFELYAHKDSGEPRVKVTGLSDVPAPESMGGKWDPEQFAPHYVFAEGEDAFPIRPDYDNDGDMGDDGGNTLEETKTDAYRDGVIDEQQALSGSFHVSRKGEYTVLTYSNYYATNKAAHYHDKDYSTAQVYLKENAQGEMEPAFLATSWHYGTQITPWQDVKKDAQGHPVIEVGRGSHSLQPLGADQEIPEGGLHIQGDGTATMDGKSIGHEMTYDSLQTNVKNARYLDPDSDAAAARRSVLGFGSTAADPLLPELLAEYDTGAAVAGRLESDIEKLFDEVEDPAKRQSSLMIMLDAAASAGAAGSQAYFDGVQRALEGIDVSDLTSEGRAEMRAVAELFDRRGTEHSDMRAQALRLMADPAFDPEVARQLTYAMENGENNARNIQDALDAATEGSPEAEAIRLVVGAIMPQESLSFKARFHDED